MKKTLTIIFSVSLGLFIGYFLFSTAPGSVQTTSLPPYRFASIEDFSVEATGVWDIDEFQKIPGIEAEAIGAVTIECELYNHVCHEISAQLVTHNKQVFLYAPYITSYDIEFESEDRIIARKSGGVVTQTLDISLVSETVQKETLVKEGELAKYSLISGIK